MIMDEKYKFNVDNSVGKKELVEGVGALKVKMQKLRGDIAASTIDKARAFSQISDLVDSLPVDIERADLSANKVGVVEEDTVPAEPVISGKK